MDLYMIDHFNLPVSNIENSLKFYQQVLEPLGYRLLFQDQDAYGFGTSHWQFGIYPVQEKIIPLHVAFIAKTSTAVDEFFNVAINLGAKPNGDPGLREEYGAGYYAAYICDYEGHNIEAVCRLSA